MIQWRAMTRNWQVVQTLFVAGAPGDFEQTHQHTQPLKICKKLIWFLLSPINSRFLFHLLSYAGWKQPWVSSFLRGGAHQFLGFSSFLFLNIFSSPVGFKIYKLDSIRFIFIFIVETILSCDFLYPKLKFYIFSVFSRTICWTDILSVLNSLGKFIKNSIFSIYL